MQTWKVLIKIEIIRSLKKEYLGIEKDRCD